MFKKMIKSVIKISLSATAYVCNYVIGVGTRLKQATYNERGLFIGGSIGAIYSGLRGYFTSGYYNLPLLGDVHIISELRILLGLLIGGYSGCTIGNRIGQCIKVHEAGQENSFSVNQLFIMKYYPLVSALIVDILIAHFQDDKKSFFRTTVDISDVEGYMLTTLYAIYVSGTVGFRGGKYLDILTNNYLVSDLGVTTLYQKTKQYCFSSSSNHNSIIPVPPVNSSNNSRCPTVIIQMMPLPMIAQEKTQSSAKHTSHAIKDTLKQTKHYGIFKSTELGRCDKLVQDISVTDTKQANGIKLKESSNLSMLNCGTSK